MQRISPAAAAEKHLTIPEAEALAATVITDRTSALDEAIHMLTEIAHGRSYGTFEYMAKLMQMRKMGEQPLRSIASAEPTNADRAERAEKTLTSYAHIRGEIADESDMRDLLSDLMHFCARRDDTDFDDEMEMARVNFNAEIDEEEDAADPDGANFFFVGLPESCSFCRNLEHACIDHEGQGEKK